MKLNKRAITDIETYALEQYPNEMVGIIVSGDFIPLPNSSKDKENSIELLPEHYAQYCGRIEAVIHSHTCKLRNSPLFDPRTPSKMDMLNQPKTKVPWGIVATDGTDVMSAKFFPRVPNNNYIGREFTWYINDCFTIVQDYYKFELDIEIPNHPYDYDLVEVMRQNYIYDKGYKAAGFIDLQSIENLQNGDILVVHQGNLKGNHLAVVHDGQLLHQDMLSCFIPLNTFTGRIHKVLRHASKNI